MTGPPIVIPEELGISIDEIFHPVDPVQVPEISGVLSWLAQHDPEVLGAVAEVDRSLIWMTLELDPRERLHQSLQMGLTLDALADKVRQQAENRGT
jgi:hypothetical protein